VLYEMLTGKQAFESRDSEGVGTVQDILAAVLEREPNWKLLPTTTPQSIRILLGRCLQKDAKKRIRDAADVRIEIEDALSSPATPIRAATVPAGALWQRTLSWAGCLLAGAIMASLAIWNLRPAPYRRPVSRMVVTLPAGDRLSSAEHRALALSPDGK